MVEKRPLQFPFYSWDDLEYQYFMMDFFRLLENRCFNAREQILGELEECQDLLFVQKGLYVVGYEINKVEKLKLLFGERTTIGGFNMCFR